jgi:phosphate transport system substrate-binding protein
MNTLHFPAADVCRLRMRRWRRAGAVLTACVWFALLAAPVLAQTLRVGGTGSSAPLMALLFDEFRRQTPDAALDQVSPPLGSGGAIKALAGGRLDLALIARPLKPEEARTVGRSLPLASTALVLATKDERRTQGFRRDELAAVYAGRLTAWDDGKPIRLVLRASTESDTLLLKSMSPEMAAAVEAAGQRPGMAMGQDDLDTAQLLLAAPGSLGPTTMGLLTTQKLRLQALPIDGIAPTLGNLESGRYPWSKTITLVLAAKPAPLAEKFATFVGSEAAASILRRHDYLPATK